MSRAPVILSKSEVIEALLTDAGMSGSVDVTQVVGSGSPGAPSRADSTEWELIRLPVLASQGRSLEAIGLCHAIRRAWRDEGARRTTLVNVAELQSHLEGELLCQEIEFRFDDITLRPLARDAVLIGRPSPTHAVDVSIDCRWFSRGERSLSLHRKESGWVVTDAGSSNGSYIGDKALVPGTDYMLPLGATTVDIGRTDDQRTPVVLTLDRLATNAVVIRVGVGAGFQTGSRQTWPSIEHDIRMRWLVFAKRFALRATVLGPTVQSDANPGADISFDDGYWIIPAQETPLKINGVAISAAVPLAPNASIEVDGLRFQTELPVGVDRP
jgi:hypothetical protein